MAKISNSKDFLMLLFYAKGHKGNQCEPIRGRTRIMKMVFLFEKEIRRKFNLDKAISSDILPAFEPYDFGPFSSQVFSDLEFLIELGLLGVKPVHEEDILPESGMEYDYWQASAGIDNGSIGPEYEEDFQLTTLGKQFVQDGEAGSVTKEQEKALDEFKARCTGVSLRSLLKYVYTKYPETTTESKIRTEISLERY